MNLLFCSKLSGKNDQGVFDLLKDNKNLKIGYIPSATSADNKYFKQIKNYYRQNYKLRDIICLDVDKNYNKEYFYNNISNCNILILSGGDTQYFLNNLKKRKLLKVIKAFARGRNRFIIGISAGGIIMTPRINIGEMLDGAEKNSKNNKGLSLVDFEFFPHFNKNYNDLIKKYSLRNKRKIIICSEKDVVFVNNKNKNKYDYYLRGRYYGNKE
jgi:dipeptidase E